MRHMKRSALISESGVYRYTLHRDWHGLAFSEPRTLLFVMLNPSTANADKDDPTVRRCIGFAHRWGFTRLSVVNLSAYRATNPRELLEEHQRAGALLPLVGIENDKHIAAEAKESDRIILGWGAWGANKKLNPRALEVIALLRSIPRKESLWCLGARLQGGAPRHPLFTPANAPLQVWG